MRGRQAPLPLALLSPSGPSHSRCLVASGLAPLPGFFAPQSHRPVSSLPSELSSHSFLCAVIPRGRGLPRTDGDSYTSVPSMSEQVARGGGGLDEQPSPPTPRSGGLGLLRSFILRASSRQLCAAGTWGPADGHVRRAAGPGHRLTLPGRGVDRRSQVPPSALPSSLQPSPVTRSARAAAWPPPLPGPGSGAGAQEESARSPGKLRAARGAGRSGRPAEPAASPRVSHLPGP